MENTKIRNIKLMLRWMPDRMYIQLYYFAKFHRFCDLKHPKLYNEKIQWLKLNTRNPKLPALVDKYAVKEIIRNRLGEEYVVKCYGVWDSFDEIDFDSLPEKFVLKCTHDSGGIVVCTNKARFDLAAAREKLTYCLSQNYFYISREHHYKSVPPRIIAEEYLENGSEGLHDYKVFCFNGEPKYINYVSGRLDENNIEEAFYDTQWNIQPFLLHHPMVSQEIPKPKCLDMLVEFSRELSKGMIVSRIDFYVLKDGQIKFGEVTPYPLGGMEVFKPDEWNLKMGELVKLPIDE